MIKHFYAVPGALELLHRLGYEVSLDQQEKHP